MSGSREKDQADFDLDAFIELFDEALTSDDPSVQKTLQHLMVICALARNHAKHDRRNGPMRRLFDDQHEIIRRLERLEVGNSTLGGGYRPAPMPGTIPGTTQLPWVTTSPSTTPAPGTGPYTWPYGPGITPIWSGGDTSVSLASDSAVAKSSTSYAYDPPNPASQVIAERVDDLLKSNYKGSSVGTVNVKTS